MSAREVLQNIHYFFATVLPDASHAKNWTIETLNHAFHWARYCEKVYETAVNKPYADVLGNHVRSIGDSLGNEYSPGICLEHLKASSKILCQALLSNQFIEGASYQHVLKEANEKSILKEVLQTSTEMKSLLVILVEFFGSAKASTNFDKLSQKINSQLLLEHVRECIFTSSSKQEVKECLSEFLKESFSNAEKMKKMLLMILNCSIDKLDDAHHIQQLFLNQLLQRVGKSEKLFEPTTACYLWNQPPAILLALSAISFPFYKCYVGVLVELVNSMEADYTGTDVRWKPSCSSTESLEFSFTDILSHFNALLCSQTKVSQSTKILISSLANNSNESAIWGDILNNTTVC